MKRNFKFFLAILIFLFSFYSFSESVENLFSDLTQELAEDKKIQTGCLYGLSSIPFASLKYICEVHNYFPVNVNFYSSQKEIVSDFLNKKTAFIFVPYQTALEILQAFPDEVVLSAIVQKSNVYLISAGEKINALSDLLGKTVSIPKDDMICQKLFKWLCYQYGIPVNKGPRGITLNDLDTSAEIVPKIVNRSVRYAVLGEPYSGIAMKKNRKNFLSLDLQKEFDSVIGKFSYFPETVMIVHRNFSHTKEFAAFSELLKKLFPYILKNPEETALCNKMFNLPKTDEFSRLSLFNLNFCFVNDKSIFDELFLSSRVMTYNEANSSYFTISEKNVFFTEAR